MECLFRILPISFVVYPSVAETDHVNVGYRSAVYCFWLNRSVLVTSGELFCIVPLGWRRRKLWQQFINVGYEGEIEFIYYDCDQNN